MRERNDLNENIISNNTRNKRRKIKDEEEGNQDIPPRRFTEEEHSVLQQQQQQQELQMSGDIFKLPRDLFLDILSRLPIKSISQCRWVCKPWCDILHSPPFTKIQLARTNFPCVILHDRLRHTSDFYLVEQEGEETLDSLPTSTVLKTHFNRSNEKFHVVGSCNGLLCLSPISSHDPVYICNPITGEYMRLPRPSKCANVGIISAFGFAPTTNEYKVIRMLHHGVDKNRSFKGEVKVEVEIYTLGSGRWRTIADFPYPLSFNRSHVFVNGALHWITNEYSTVNLCQFIVSFDLGSEEFRAVPPPPCFIPVRESVYYDLGVLDERLCLIHNGIEDLIVVWMMKDYGMKESWTIEYLIRKHVLGRGELDFKLLRVMKNGEILLLCGHTTLGYYDPKRGFRSIQIRGVQSRFDQLEAIVHIGSLISLSNIGV